MGGPVVVPTSMKAAIVEAHKKPLVFKDVPVPELALGQVLVKILYSGVCHTDVHINDGDWDNLVMPTPIIPGHEGCGEVVKLGPEVTDLKIGDRVGIPWMYEACGKCYNCRDGWETVCGKVKNAGFNVNGGFAQYVVAPADYVGRIPDNLSYEQAAPLLCAGVTVYKALKVSEVKPGQYVVITGASGGLGHLACQYAKVMGMKVLGVTRSLTPEKEKMLKGFGVDTCIDLSKGKVGDLVKAATDGAGCHGVICLAPENQDITDAVNYVRPRGVIVPVAIPSGDFGANTVMVALHAVKIVGSIVGTRNDLQEALEFGAQGKVKCVVTVRKFDEVNEILTELRKGAIQGRVVMKMPH